MSYGWTKGKRRSNRYRKYRRSYATRTRRTRRRYYRRKARTVSSVVKLTQDANWTLGKQGSGVAAPVLWNAFSFSPVSLPGFSDYQATYSHFRILKARLYVSRSIGSGDGALNNYLVVGSRPFAATTAGVDEASTLADKYVPPQPETQLRQTKWQKVHYPNTTTQRVSIGFYPYTMVGTFGPVGIGNPSQYQRIWEAKKWMPFTWAYSQLANQGGLAFFGPYLVVDTATGELPMSPTPNVQCTLQLHVQFKGQR